MSRQINLYHPRFLKKRDWLSLTNVAVATIGVLLLLGGAGAWAMRQAAARQAEASAAESRLKTIKEQFETATRAAAARSKPSPQLAQEVADAEQLMQRRVEIARLLESGAIGNTDGFAETLRGLARQAPEGLWLTGFTIAAGGTEMEVRGRMLNPATLPDYIRRLGGEKAFRGRSFAALTLNRPVVVAPAATPATAVPAAPSIADRAIDFVLTPRLAVSVEGAAPKDAKAEQKQEHKL